MVDIHNLWLRTNTACLPGMLLYTHTLTVEVVSSVCTIMRYPGKADIAMIAD